MDSKETETLTERIIANYPEWDEILSEQPIETQYRLEL